MDRVVFKKIADGTGGRLRAAVSGGAPVSAETQEFLTVTLCPVLQGYGMTESCGMLSLQILDDIGVYGNVGSPSPACEIKLVATNNYEPNPSPLSGIPPRGELWVRGPIVMKGYYKQPKVTAENLTDDGWLMTGDIAEWASDGSIRIIDRKKNLVKLAHGEYVALEKLESQYKISKYVLNLCIHADPHKDKIVGIILPDQKELATLQASLGLESTDITNPSLLEKFGADFLVAAKKGGFKGAEILVSFCLVDGEWTAENELLTAAQKVPLYPINPIYFLD
jgi:long-chain acyl-CoA synthetase